MRRLLTLDVLNQRANYLGTGSLIASCLTKPNQLEFCFQEDFTAMENWIDDLPCCKEAGTGFQTNQKYQAGYGRRELHEREDRSFHVKFPCSKVSLYGVFDGHDSARVAHFAAQKIPADLLFDGEIAGKVNI